MEPPNEFVCCISGDVFNDPVFTLDGHTYERADITQWFRNGKNTSPMTGLPLPDKRLIKNIALSKLISDWKDAAAAAADTSLTRRPRPAAVKLSASKSSAKSHAHKKSEVDLVAATSMHTINIKIHAVSILRHANDWYRRRRHEIHF